MDVEFARLYNNITYIKTFKLNHIMALETFLEPLKALPIPTEATLFIIFVVFLFLAHKVFKAIFKIVGFGAVGALFPVFSKQVGYVVAISLQNILAYGLLGMIIGFIFVIVGSMLKMFKKNK